MLHLTTSNAFNVPLTGKRKADDAVDARGPEEPWNMQSASGSVSHNDQVEKRLPVYGKYQLPRASGNEDGWSAFLFDPIQDADHKSFQSVSMFGVFDGHSGDLCSKHCVRSLHKHLQEQLTSSLAQQPTGAVLDDVAGQALVQAFQCTDADIRDMPLVGGSGSTATVALITSNSIHIAWAGDSRAVLLGKGKTLAQTIDHRADREDEQERVTALGGRVFFNSGMRVMGILATTRAIGDHDLQPYGVVPTPEVLSIPRTDEQEFLVLASDGLWDVMSHEEVLDYAKKTLTKVQQKHADRGVLHRVCSPCQAAGIAARALALCARKQRHSKDDITVLLVNLKMPCTCAPPLGAHNVSNSSLMSKATASLVRTQGIFGSSSADQLERVASGSRQRSQHLAEQGQQQLQTGTSQSLLLQLLQQPSQQPQQQQEQPPSQQRQQQSSQQRQQMQYHHQQQQPVLKCPKLQSCFGAGLLVQPSVCPVRPMATTQEPVLGPKAAAARAGSASDLVLLSPFAATTAVNSAVVAVPATTAAVLVPGVMQLFTPVFPTASAPTSASSGECTDDDNDLVTGLAAAVRPIGSAPAHIPEGLVAGALQQSLHLALSGSRSCCLPPTGSLESAELPVVC